MTKQIRKWLALIFFFFFCFCLVAEVYGQTNPWLEEVDRYTYVKYTGGSVSVAWDPVSNATFYQLRLYLYERKVYTEIEIVPGETYTWTFSTNKSGHYIVEARSVNDNNGTLTYSEWAVSTNPTYATVKGVSRAWWVYCYVAPPGGVVITR